MRYSLLPLLALLAACGTQPTAPVVERGGAAPLPAPEPAPAVKQPVAKPPAYILKRGGGFYKDDGPGDNPPPDLAAIPDAVPKSEPLHKFANNPYSVLGRDYVPLRQVQSFREVGRASWYGRKFHGQKTSSGEIYDMYGMTAAHPTLPIPSYARVTNPANGKFVIVRINDRGPFHDGRIIDLSYTAAWKLDLVGGGSGLVEVVSALPGSDAAPVLAQAPQQDELMALLAETPPDPPAKPLPQSSDANGTWLQLGAFGSRDNAEALKSRLARELDNGLGDKLVVQPAGKLYRLQLGPWASVQEARQVAERLAQSLDARPVVVQRQPL